LGYQIKENEIGWTCGTYGRDERCIQGFGGETLGKETTLKPRRKWEDSIKMDLQELDGEAWTGLIWPRIGTGEGRLRMP
jgi:hypothetical protein